MGLNGSISKKLNKDYYIKKVKIILGAFKDLSAK